MAQPPQATKGRRASALDIHLRSSISGVPVRTDTTRAAYPGKDRWRHPMTHVPISINPVSALECLLKEVGLIVIRVGEKPAGSVAVIGGDDNTPPGCETFHQAPEIIVAQMFPVSPGQRRQALASLVMVVQAMIRPVMPVQPVGFRADEVSAVFLCDVRRFRSCSDQFMHRSCTIVAEH